MNLGISFFITSIMLGAGLAMDAFSVSHANGLNEPTMKKAECVVWRESFLCFSLQCH